MWHAGKAAVQSAAQSPEGKQQGSRWPWQQEDAANQVGVTVLLCSLHATGAVRCLFGDCNAERWRREVALCNRQGSMLHRQSRLCRVGEGGEV